MAPAAMACSVMVEKIEVPKPRSDSRNTSDTLTILSY
jgi:hypothetical protein